LDLTKKTFEETLRNTGCLFNLVVIDNASSDDSFDWIDYNIKKFENIADYRLVRMKKNMGIAYGRNMGLKIYDDFFSDSGYLCCLDNDVILDRQWLKDCCDVLEANKMIAACGVNLEGKNYPKSKVKRPNGESINIQIKPRGNLGTAAMVFPKSVHEALGFFCTEYEMYAHEDSDMGWRMRMLKKILVYLEKPGIHIGVGDNDGGEYREMKDKYWKINMPKHDNNLRAYTNGLKSIYVSFNNFDVKMINFIITK